MSEGQALPCGCAAGDRDDDPKGPVYWNEFNGVVQCHRCGETYVPRARLTEAREKAGQLFQLIGRVDPLTVKEEWRGHFLAWQLDGVKKYPWLKESEAAE